MKNSLDTFIAISLRLGGNPFWVQGPGGNTSVKIEDGTQIVKSSGSELQFVTESDGFALCRTESVNARLKTILIIPDEMERELEYSETVAKANLYPEKHKRPSMELGIHTLLPFKYVLHFHSPCGLIAAHLYEQRKFSSLPSPSNFGINISWMDFCLPGFSLAEQILKINITNSPVPQLIILKNHGVIVCCDHDPQTVMDDYSHWESAFWNATENIYPYEKTADRASLYDFAVKNPTNTRPLYPDSVILENRIAQVTALSSDGNFHLKPELAAKDQGAADIFAVECLIKKRFPDIASIGTGAQQKIRDMPAEIARKKNMQGAK